MPSKYTKYLESFKYNGGEGYNKSSSSAASSSSSSSSWQQQQYKQQQQQQDKYASTSNSSLKRSSNALPQSQTLRRSIRRQNYDAYKKNNVHEFRDTRTYEQQSKAANVFLPHLHDRSYIDQGYSSN